MLHIKTVEQWNELIKENETVYFLKHSDTCSLSEIAWGEFESFASKNDVVTAYLIVQEDRPLSNYIAETFGITHHSPQFFKLVNGQPVYHTSHRNITKDELEKYL